MTSMPRSPSCHLGHLVVMGVVHVGPMLPDGVFVFERLARLDSALGQSSHAIHALGSKRPCQWIVVASGSRLVT